ncbi:MAG: hypothetical protein HQ483_09535 [Rhodospirillales bacterium]|nr:hypothetical protein [Rhodospirillales bacterium]
MQELFSEDLKWLWIAAMALALFFPVRQFIWVTTVRRHIRKSGDETVSADEQIRLKKRAAVTSLLLSGLFSLFYISFLFHK